MRHPYKVNPTALTKSMAGIIRWQIFLTCVTGDNEENWFANITTARDI